MLDNAWSDMLKKYRDKKEEREIITLAQNEYDYLLSVLKSEFQYSIEVTDDTKEDETIRACAFGNIKLLKKYIDMLENETVKSEHDNRICIPFYKDFGNDLFLFLLANISGRHYII